MQLRNELIPMEEWICTKCYKVIIANNFECCGQVEIFEVAKHGHKLVPLSNAWLNVNKWQEHPLYKEVSQKLADEGCFSASTVFNVFIEELINQSATP